ncbi:MAG: ATPase [Gammaproteobacteria bacterium]|nr:ATPase [Gammaproteobacteria bacterium]
MDETRQIFVGDAALATGFRLAGFEVVADAGVAQLDEILEELRNTRAHAFVVIDQQLAESDSQRLAEVRREGGRILLTQVPSLTEPDKMHSSVDNHIQQLLGLDGDKP